ncbi:uncharacterized protein L201_004225 [Kwoniella dendrophila CBS 6074]|uniref:Uncharacterized protein n=1 Tax=Kwoniella dendrophila CBS 6074 TaxID=1295534 RepID=A0AAX4JWX8_9TREE
MSSSLSSSSSSSLGSPRPLTPFPHTHTLTHGNNGSYFHSIHYEMEPHKYTSQPIHFQLKKPLITPTPPSLIGRKSSLKRVPSASSSSSSFSSTSPLVIISPIPRRASSSFSSNSSSISSPPMPTTPILEESPNAPPSTPTPLSLPPPSVPIQVSAFASSSSSKGETNSMNEMITIISESEFSTTTITNFNYDPYSISLSTGEEIASTYYNSEYTSKQIKRPKFKRRDTPIPKKTTTLNSLKMSMVQDDDGRKLLRSVIDGGNWVIVP